VIFFESFHEAALHRIKFGLISAKFFKLDAMDCLRVHQYWPLFLNFG